MENQSLKSPSKKRLSKSFLSGLYLNNFLSKLKTRHEFKEQNILAIEDGMAPPTKKMKVASDEDIRTIVQIWESQPMRISLEDHIFPSKNLTYNSFYPQF